MKKNIAYAVANYEQIVDDGYYFVDKTRFIRELEKYRVPVLLRPRRFGKSLWCSILECYYDVRRGGRFDALFGTTDIGRAPTKERSTYMVLRLDFSLIRVNNDYQSVEKEFDDICREALKTFACRYGEWLVEELDSEGRSSGSLLNAVLSMVKRHDAPPLFVIIDEYDNFTNQMVSTGNTGLYEEVTTGESFLRTFFKVIKAGVGEGTVGRVFITGVLPITIDDLTSGFNIAQVITLKENLLTMFGFTQTETDVYLDELFTDYGWGDVLRESVGAEVKARYNGYRLLPGSSETLYNSTILNYYLNELVIHDGCPPVEPIDENLRVDVNWLRRLAGSQSAAREALEQLMYHNTMPANMSLLRSKFNANRFFDPSFLPISLYYLGMLTFLDDFALTFPNLTVKTIFTDYYNELEEINISSGYETMFRQFLKDGDWADLFAGYWRQYIGQIPAQAFDKVNENFFRTTFYSLCTQFLSRYFVFTIEENLPSGRADWQALGRTGTRFESVAAVMEFKHFPRNKGTAQGVLDLERPSDEDICQITEYADDVQLRHCDKKVRRFMVYTVGCAGFRVWEV